MKRPVTAALPPCGTCDLKIKNTDAGAGKDDYWCHGGPPSAYVVTVVTHPPGGGEPIPGRQVHSQYPPVHSDTVGCALHQIVRSMIFGRRP